MNLKVLEVYKSFRYHAPLIETTRVTIKNENENYNCKREQYPVVMELVISMQRIVLLM